MQSPGSPGPPAGRGPEGQNRAGLVLALAVPALAGVSHGLCQARGTMQRLSFSFLFYCSLAFLSTAQITPFFHEQCGVLAGRTLSVSFVPYVHYEYFLSNYCLCSNVVCGLLLYGVFDIYGVKFVSLFLNGFWIMSCSDGPTLPHGYDNSRLYFFLILL